MDFSGIDVEGYSFEDFLILDRCMKIRDVKHGIACSYASLRLKVYEKVKIRKAGFHGTVDEQRDMRTLAMWIVLLSLCMARADTLVTEAKIAQLSDHGFVLMVGTEPLAVEYGPETRFWRSRALGKREDFTEGQQVFARIKTDADPPILREISDKPTWQWLDAIRKNPRLGTVEKIDTKYLTLRFDDGSSFAYRATDKSEVKLGGKAGTLGDLTAGMKLYAKGRTLANLDTWLVLITDQPIEAKKAASSKKRDAKPQPLPSTGTLEGISQGIFVNLKMFDLQWGNRALHITYNSATRWTLDGKAANVTVYQRDLTCIVTYKRDKAGRIIATKVDLSHR